MKRIVTRWLVAGIAGMLAACAFITVNVYFPEKDVKQAYKSLDEMLLKKDTPAQPDEMQPGTERKERGDKPVSMIPSSFGFVAAAYAQENLGEVLAQELSAIPEVQKAYDEMRARLSQLNELRDSGVIGEAANGSVVLRDQTKATEAQAIVQAENANRKTIIVNMAKAVLKLNKQPESKEALSDAVRKAAALFAETKREEAKPGWWIQNAAGRWVQK